MPPNVALMHMVAAAGDRAEIEASLNTAKACDSAAAARLDEARRLWQDAAGAWPMLRAILSAADQAPGGSVAYWSALFDRAVAISPEASVALYSLGCADLLDQATKEIAALMAGWGLLGPDRIAVEIGCGIGRFLGPVAGHGGRVLGIDVSAGMLAEAGRRCRGVRGIGLVLSGGADLGCIRDGCANLVYAIDSFPYLVAADLVAAHVAEAGRVLKPGGTLLVMNWSYRGDDAADRAEAAKLAAENGLIVVERGAAGLRHWDGKVYRLDKPQRREP